MNEFEELFSPRKSIYIQRLFLRCLFFGRKNAGGNFVGGISIISRRYLDYLDYTCCQRFERGKDWNLGKTLRKTNKGVSEWYETTCNDTLWYTM